MNPRMTTLNHVAGQPPPCSGSSKSEADIPAAESEQPKRSWLLPWIHEIERLLAARRRFQLQQSRIRKLNS
jgi:hypothetical protein